MTASIRLIVNADDYGYFHSVSRGIRAAHRAGAVTATGIMANGPAFAVAVAELAELPQLDLGVHLNLSYGAPLTAALAGRLAQGRFAGKFAALAAVARGHWPLALVAAEWRAQIERCSDAGLKVCFINSHEHVHMYPPLYRIAAGLAAEYGIRWLRRTTPEWHGSQGLLRNLLLGLMAALTPADATQPRLLGLAGSGRLGIPELRTALTGLEAGRTYELMCHPGEFDGAELVDPALRVYHDWSRELAALTHPDFVALCREAGIRLATFRELHRV
ncbi:carbohydrate deacetylase [Plasticicumulans acidivorans]|uniref:Glycoside hydrolase/deacetylase ChbG (UPF0249 family) n=1 Tax=Plasticicumulans acidivorans TaxID=886464 RepID=A0A317MUQ1_9GAMM|nr:ChbG/HpnK family deacetylase [Plasticicumulans acidivorans]PWV61107.1 hypothetical protein C7443_106121 [Plasticicumulans acidivorans]